LSKFFSGLAEHVFLAELGVADPPLVDYLSNLVFRFVRMDAIYRIRDAAGRPLREVAEMVAEAEHRVADARRQVHRHIGDFTLFWVGMYPEALRRMRGSDRKDYFIDYRTQGKRAYLLASQIDADEDPPAAVLERLSDQYELCAFGLRLMRREWEHEAGQGDSPRPQSGGN
jgi:hypothetical protein